MRHSARYLSASQGGWEGIKSNCTHMCTHSHTHTQIHTYTHTGKPCRIHFFILLFFFTPPVNEGKLYGGPEPSSSLGLRQKASPREEWWVESTAHYSWSKWKQASYIRILRVLLLPSWFKWRHEVITPNGIPCLQASTEKGWVPSLRQVLGLQTPVR